MKALSPNVLRQARNAYLLAAKDYGWQHAITKAANALGIKPNTLSARLRSMPDYVTLMEQGRDISKPALVVDPPAPEPEKDPIEATRQRLEHRRAVQQERTELEAVAGERSFRQFLTDLVHQNTPHLDAPPRYQAPALSFGCSTETLVYKWSDWHGYEKVSSERTRGLNEYNADIMAQRIKRIVDSIISIKTKMERGGGWRFPRGVVALNGDMQSGTIHEVERHSDAPNVIMAVYGMALVLAQALRDVAAFHEVLDVFCTSGNHGRLPDARRMQQKDPTRSWDTMIYLIAKEALRDLSHVHFHIPDAYAVAYDVEGWTFLQTHGHEVKSWNSIPHYGINRMVSNLNALEAARNHLIHYFLFGHFHSKSSLDHAAGESFINGSLIGGTEFAVNGLGKSDKPSQWMLAVHKEHGVTHRWPLSALTPSDAPGYAVTPWLEAA